MSEQLNYRTIRLVETSAKQTPEEILPDPSASANTLSSLALTFLIGHSLGLVLPGAGEALSMPTAAEPTTYVHAMDGLVATVEYADNLRRY